MKKNSSLFLLLLLSARPVFAFETPKGAAAAVLTLPDGFKVEVELALTREEQSKGLMFRTELKQDRGMLFVFEETADRSFWMKNTFVELDIVFMDKELAVKKVFHRVTPSAAGQRDSEVSVVSAPARYVLELAGGAARKHGLKPGARLKINFPPSRGKTKKEPSEGRRP